MAEITICAPDMDEAKRLAADVSDLMATRGTRSTSGETHRWYP